MDSFNKVIKELASDIYIMENNLIMENNPAYAEDQIRFVNEELEKFKKQNLGKYVVLSRYDGTYRKFGTISDTNPEAIFHPIPTRSKMLSHPRVCIRFSYDGCYSTMFLASFRHDNMPTKFIIFDDEASADLFLMVNGGMLDV